MSYRRPPQPVEDYTQAFLVSFGVLLFFVLFAIAAIWGFFASLFSSYAMDRAIVVGGAWSNRRNRSD